MQTPSKPDILVEDYVPRPTIGAVPKRASGYKFFPIWLPKRPEYARDPEVVKLGDKLMEQIRTDVKKGRVTLATDPWRRRYEWQNHPYFASKWYRLRLAFPGLGIAAMAFVTFVALDNMGVISSLADSHESHH